MGFSTYDEFRSAIADPARTLTMFHTLNALQNSTSATETFWQFPEMFTGNTDTTATGGVILDHTSITSSSTLNGTLGLPLPMPSVTGRSWYLYGVDVSGPSAPNHISLTMFDAVWFCKCLSNNTLTSYTVSGFPTLPRYADGRGLNAIPISTTITGGSQNFFKITGDSYDGTLAASDPTGWKHYYRNEASAVNNGFRAQRASLSANQFGPKRNGLFAGQGGVKNVSAISHDYVIPSVAVGIFLMKQLLRIPLPKSPNDNRVMAQVPLFNQIRPFIKLAPGSNGNYPCLVFALELGGDATGTSVATNITMRLKFVEG